MSTIFVTIYLIVLAVVYFGIYYNLSRGERDEMERKYLSPFWMAVSWPMFPVLGLIIGPLFGLSLLTEYITPEARELRRQKRERQAQADKLKAYDRLRESEEEESIRRGEEYANKPKRVFR